MGARKQDDVHEAHDSAVLRGQLARPARGTAGRGARHRRRLRAARVQRLADMRKLYGYSRQSDVALLMGVSRPRVSKVESGDPTRLELGTIQSYVAALGGKLRVVADFGETSVELSA